MSERTWISIKDQRPTEEQDVFYFFEWTGVNKGKYQGVPYDPEHFGTDEDGNPYVGNCFYGKKGFLTDDVTHWMPYDGNDELPPKPEGFEDEKD